MLLKLPVTCSPSILNVSADLVIPPGKTISLLLPVVISSPGTVLQVPTTSTLRISPTDPTQSFITLSGCAQLSGTLFVDLATTYTSVTVLQQNTSCPTSRFTDVEVSISGRKSCSATQSYTGGRLEVLITSGCKQKKKIWIFALAAVAGVAILVAIAIVFYFMAYRKRYCRSCDCLWRSSDETRRGSMKNLKP